MTRAFVFAGCVFVVLGLCWSLFTHQPGTVRAQADDPGIEYVGRFLRGDDGSTRFAWPASQLRVRFSGSSIRALLTDTPLEDTTRETDWLDVEIDGKRRRPLALREGTHSYVIARALTRGPHTLVLTKRTEAEVGTITLHAFEVSGIASVLPPLVRRTRRIEVIGDSISAGYGNEGRNAKCGWSAKREDASRTYAAVAARELDAELVNQAWSGKGVTRNYDARDRDMMVDIFDRVLPSAPSSPRAAPMAEPDLVLIHLGTNDFLAGVPVEAEFLTAYRTLLERVRKRSPRAPLAIALGPLLADDYPHAGARSTLKRWLMALKSEREALGERVMFVEQWTDPAEGLGCDSHPSLKTHARLGRELAEAARDQLGW